MASCTIKSLFDGFLKKIYNDVELNCDFYWDQVNQTQGCATINDKIETLEQDLLIEEQLSMTIGRLYIRHINNY